MDFNHSFVDFRCKQKRYVDPNVRFGKILIQKVMKFECGYSVVAKSDQQTPVLVGLVDGQHKTGKRKILSINNLSDLNEIVRQWNLF